MKDLWKVSVEEASETDEDMIGTSFTVPDCDASQCEVIEDFVKLACDKKFGFPNDWCRYSVQSPDGDVFFVKGHGVVVPYFHEENNDDEGYDP